MTISVDSAASTGATSTNTLTFAHTVAAGADSILVVGIGNCAATPKTVNSVTYDGVSLAQVPDAGATYSSARGEMWYLVAPPAGTADVVVTLSASADELLAGSVSLFGVDQSSSFGTVAITGNTGTAPDPTVDVSASVDDLVIDFVVENTGSGSGITPGVGQTTQWDEVNIGGSACGGMSTEAGATTVTMSWTIAGGGAANVLIGIAIHPSTGGGQPPRSMHQYRLRRAA